MYSYSLLIILTTDSLKMQQWPLPLTKTQNEGWVPSEWEENFKLTRKGVGQPSYYKEVDTQTKRWADGWTEGWTNIQTVTNRQTSIWLVPLLHSPFHLKTQWVVESPV